MYIEKKKIGKKEYNYLKVSAREGSKTNSRTVAYLGRAPMTKKQVEAKIALIPGSKIESVKKELKNELKQNKEDINKEFLSKERLEKLDTIKKDFNKKLKLNKKLVEDMFKDFKTYYVYNTNAIEGNTLTLKETNSLLNENKVPSGKDLREVYDHINEKETFDYILKTKPELSAQLMIEIHSRLLKNIDERTGSFRMHNVRVFGADFETTDARYVFTDINILMKWYSDNKRKLHPLILAAAFHEKFERIHPFYDGNGRTGRMLLNLILLRNNLPPLIVKNKTRNEYYRVLSISHKADLTKTEPKHYKELVHFYCKQLLETYEKIFSKWG